MSIKACLSSKTDDWSTPQDFFDKLNDEFHFDLDPCADETNHKCQRFYTREQDGLEQAWEGNVFCNPPYGREIGKWVRKAYEEARKGATVVMLIPVRTDTAYFHDYIYGKAEIRFVRGRLRFGNATCGAPFPSMVVVFRKRRITMAECIERANLVERISIIITHTPEDSGEHYAWSIALNEVLNCPAADVAPVVHGTWMHYGCDDEIVTCSRCGYEAYAEAFYVREGTNCPMCGAKMK